MFPDKLADTDDFVTESSKSNILNIPVVLEIKIGSARLTIDKVSKLSEGSVIPLNKKIGEPAELSVNGRVLAHGNIIVVEEGSTQLGIVITEII